MNSYKRKTRSYIYDRLTHKFTIGYKFTGVTTTTKEHEKKMTGTGKYVLDFK